MSFNKVSAGNAIQWFSNAINLLMKNLATFIIMALITAAIGLINFIPVLGLIAVAFLSPALYGGYVYAANKQFNGEQAQIGDLFAAFTQPEKLKPMLTLGVPVGAAALLFFLLNTLGVLSTISSGTSAVIVAVLITMSISAVLYAVAYTFVFYAIPRVMLEGVEPVQAMKDSVAAILGNIPAMLVFGLLYFFGTAILGFIPVLGWLVLLLVAQPIIGLSLYFAYRDIFGLGNMAGSALPPQPPVVQ